jgi:hypothetical protein
MLADMEGGLSPMPAQRLAQTLVADRRPSVLPPRAAPISARLGRALVRLVALWWWAVRWHVASLHGLPRDEAVGPPPKL